MGKEGIFHKDTPLLRWGMPLLAIIVTLLVMWPTLGNDFVNWDDPANIQNNPYIRSLDGQSISDVFSESQINGAYMPLTQISWMLDYAAAEKDAQGRPDAAPFHRMNLLLHLLNVLLVFLLARRLSGSALVGGLVALLFGIHPMHLEAVAWATSRKDVLMGAFFLGGLLVYVRGLADGKRPAALTLGLTGLLFLGAVLSKGVAVVFPAALLLIDWYVGRAGEWKRALLEKLPFFALSLVMVVVGFQGQQESEAMGELGDVSILESLLIGCYGLTMYMVEVALPFKLSAFHPYPYLKVEDMPVWLYAMPLAAVAFGVLCWWQRKNRALIFGMGFFLLLLLPVLQFLPFSIAAFAERFTYLPYIGLFFMAAVGLQWLAERYGNVVLGAAALVVVVYGGITMVHSRTWENGGTMWTNVISQYPEGHFAYGNRASYHISQGANDLAMADLNKTIQLNPYFSFAYNNRGQLLQEQGKRAEARADFTKAIELNPKLGEAWLNLGVVELNLGEHAQAARTLDRAVELMAGNALPYYNRGLAYGMGGSPQKGLADFDKAIELQGNVPVFYKDRGISRMLLGNVNGAEADFSKAIDLDPGFGEAWFRKSLCRMAAADTAAALRNAEQAVQLGFAVDLAYLNALK